MTVLYVLVPMALLMAGSAVAAFLWATRNGQLDDLETPALRLLGEDDSPLGPSRDKGPSGGRDGQSSTRAP